MTAVDYALPFDGFDTSPPQSTVAPGVFWPPKKRFIGCIVAGVIGLGGTGTLSTAVTTDDLAAMHGTAFESHTLPATAGAVSFEFAIPALLRGIRDSSGLTWGDIAQVIGVSRRAVHNWLSGGRAANVHLGRILELRKTVDAVGVGSPEEVRARLQVSGPSGRSALEEIALSTKRVNRRPIATTSVADLATSVPGDDKPIPRLSRASSVRSGRLPNRRTND